MPSVPIRYPGRARLIAAKFPPDIVEFLDGLFSRLGGVTDRPAEIESSVETLSGDIAEDLAGLPTQTQAAILAALAPIQSRLDDLEETPATVQVPAVDPAPDPIWLPQQVEQSDYFPPITIPPDLTEIETERLTITEGTDAMMGIATLSSGSVTVINANVTASTRIFLTVQTPGANQGHVYVSARDIGDNFKISSTEGADDRQVAWLLIEPSA